MSEHRKMNVVVTLLISVDVDTKGEETDTPKTEVALTNVANQVMASIIPLGGAGESTKEFRDTVATLAVKSGLQFMLNDMNGEHKEAPPKVNGPGADA